MNNIIFLSLLLFSITSQAFYIVPNGQRISKELIREERNKHAMKSRKLENGEAEVTKTAIHPNHPHVGKSARERFLELPTNPFDGDWDSIGDEAPAYTVEGDEAAKRRALATCIDYYADLHERNARGKPHIRFALIIPEDNTKYNQSIDLISAWNTVRHAKFTHVFIIFPNYYTAVQTARAKELILANNIENPSKVMFVEPKCEAVVFVAPAPPPPRAARLVASSSTSLASIADLIGGFDAMSFIGDAAPPLGNIGATDKTVTTAAAAAAVSSRAASSSASKHKKPSKHRKKYKLEEEEEDDDEEDA